MFLMQKNIAMVFKNKLFNVPVMLFVFLIIIL